MTAEEEARLAALEAKYAGRGAVGGGVESGFLGRLGRGVGNTLGSVQTGLINTAIGAADLLPGDDLPRMQPEEAPGTFFRRAAPAETGSQMAGDILGSLPGELAQLAGPQAGITGGMRLIGAGPRLAGILGAAGTGALSGLRSGDVGRQAAEFGAMGLISAVIPGGGALRTVARAMGNAAIPSASAALRGEDPFSEETLLQGAVQGVLGEAPEMGRRLLRRRTPAVVPEPAPEPYREPAPPTPETLALEWPHGDARNYSPSGEPIIIDPTLGEQGQLRLPGPVTSPDARPWQMLQWPYGGGQGIPMPEPAGTRARMAIDEIMQRPGRPLMRRAEEAPTIDTSMEVEPVTPSVESVPVSPPSLLRTTDPTLAADYSIAGPAITSGGKVLSKGKIGDIHADLKAEAMGKLFEENPDADPFSLEHAFVDNAGNVHSREAAYDAAEKAGQLNEAGARKRERARASGKPPQLEAQDLQAPEPVTTTAQAPTIEAKPVFKPAVRLSNGTLLTGESHPEILTKQLEQSIAAGAGHPERGQRGYVDQDGNFTSNLLDVARKVNPELGKPLLRRGQNQGDLLGGSEDLTMIGEKIQAPAPKRLMKSVEATASDALRMYGDASAAYDHLETQIAHPKTRKADRERMRAAQNKIIADSENAERAAHEEELKSGATEHHTSQNAELLDVLKKLGGLPAISERGAEASGELGRIVEATPTGRQNTMKFFRKSGKSLDDLRQQFNAHGFNFETPFDMLTAIEKRIASGAPHYSEKSTNESDMRRRSGSEGGFASTPALASIAGGAAGGLYGYATGDDPDDRMNRALKFGALGLAAGASTHLLGNAGGSTRKLFTRAGRNELAREANAPTAGTPKTIEQKAARVLEQYHGNVSPEVFRAMERAKGKESAVRGMVEERIPEFTAIAQTLKPADIATGEAFLNSAARPGDIATLNAAAIPDAYRDLLKAAKAAQIEGQRTLLKGESDPKRRLTIASTIGSWATRQYRAIVDPKFVTDPALEQQVVDQWSQSPEFRGVDRSIVEQELRQHIAELGQRDGTVGSSNARISDTLFKHRKDFAPDDWSFLDGLSKDPALSPQVRKFLGDMVTSRVVDMGDQAFLRTLAGQKSVYATDAVRLRGLAEREVLTPEYRALLGEITDPLTRQLLSVNKLAGSIKGAEAFNQLSKTTFPDGRKMVYSQTEMSQAMATATPAQLEAFKDYTILKDNPALGKLAGKMVPRDAADVLGAMFDTKNYGMAVRWGAILNSWMKEAITVLNPSTQIRQFAQIPFFAATARVYPHELPKLIGDYARIMRQGGALKKEIVDNHVTSANFAQNDLLEIEKRVTGEGDGLFAKGRKLARKAYRIPDDLVRGVAYLKHKDLFLDEAAKKGMTGDAANQWAIDRTLDLLRDYTMNYSALPKAVNVAKHIPIVSPFISYSYEMARISKNLGRDIATGTPAQKIHATAALAALYALPAGLSMFAKNVFLDKGDREDWDKIQELLPTNQRFGFSMPFGRNKDGTFKSVAINSWLPAADLASVIAAAARGDTEALQAENPVLGSRKSPLVSAALDVANGENYFTHEKIDTPAKQITRGLESIVPPLTPGLGYQAKKLFRSFAPNNEGGLGNTSERTGRVDSPATGLLSVAGVSVQYAQPRTLLRRAKADSDDKVGAARSDLRRVILSNAPDDAKEKARQLFKQRTETVHRELQDKLSLLRKSQ